MKAKVSRGGGFLGALNYVFDVGPDATGNKKPEHCGGNMSGTTPQELAREFAITRQLRPDIKKPVWHCSLALPEGDRLSGEKWAALSADFLREMGMNPDNFLYDVQRHRDTEHDHIHIIASRIGLDGTVWHGKFEAFKAIEATQHLEKMHGLTLTPGLGEARKERKTLTDKEVNMSLRTETQPPKLVIQNALDEVLNNGPVPAQEFIKKLTALSIRAVPNIASTGTMNGFSFEYEGVAFTGSKLGKGFSWKQLSERVLYEQARDFEELTKARRAATDRAANTTGVGAGAEPADGHTEGAGVVRPSQPSAASDAGRDNAGDNRKIDSRYGTENAGAELSHKQVVEKIREPRVGSIVNVSGNQGAEFSTTKPKNIGDRFTEESAGAEQCSGEPEEKAVPLENVERINNVSGGGRAAGADWADRFKRNSAAKRRSNLAEGDGTGKKIPESNRISAREIDPTNYLEHCGFTVKREGRHLSVKIDGDERYRVTQKSDGHWITCDNYSNGVGDNIALVQDIEPGTSFADAVYRLSGSPNTAQIIKRSPVVKRVPPIIPPQTDFDINAGREYLVNRGISLDVLKHAESSHFLRYTRGAVLFVGYDIGGTAQNVMRRATDPLDTVQKRDLRGTDKSNPQLLPGSSTTVWVVEGGTDALAAHALARRHGHPVPSVLVTGGANVKSFLETTWVQKILQFAKKIVLAFEHEKDAETQAKTDAEHEAQALQIERLTGFSVTRWWPKDPAHKDVAALNLAELQDAETQQERGPDMRP